MTMTPKEQGTYFEGEELLRPLMKCSWDVISVLELDGTIRYVSPSVEFVMGYDRSTLFGTNVLDYVHPDSRRDVAREIAAPDPGTPDAPPLKVWVRHADGSYRYLECIASDYREDSRVGGAVINSRDVTRLKANEHDLKHQAETIEEQARLIELSHDAVIVRSMSGEVLRWNQGATRTYGYTMDEAVGKIVHELLLTRWHGTTNEEVDVTLLAEDCWEGELSHTAQGGARVLVESRQVLLRDKTGHPLSVLEINRDVTRRKTAQSMLAESEEQFRLTLDLVPDGAMIVDQDGRLMKVNRLMYEIFGYSRNELLRMSYRNLFHSDDLGAHEHEWARFLSGEVGSYSTERRCVRKDGALIWIDFKVTVKRKPTGEPKYFVVIATDITQRKAAEILLSSLSERERKVLRLLAQGRSNSQIAANLYTSLGTVKRQVTNILYKLGAADRIQAAVFAARFGLFEFDQLAARESEPSLPTY